MHPRELENLIERLRFTAATLPRGKVRNLLLECANALGDQNLTVRKAMELIDNLESQLREDKKGPRP